MGDAKKWLIISWKHDDFMDGAYGKKLAECSGTYGDAIKIARNYVPDYSPVGVVVAVE